MAGDTGNHAYRGERKPNGEKTHSAYTVLSQPAVPSGIHYQGSV